MNTASTAPSSGRPTRQGLPVCAPEWSEGMRWLFDVNGCLLIENVLTDEEIARFRAAAEQVVQETGKSQIGSMIQANPVFAELMDNRIMFPMALKILGRNTQVYSSTLIANSRSNNFVQQWHQDGPSHDQYNNLAHPTPLIQLRLAYMLTDCLDAQQGGLAVIPGSHKAAGAPPKDVLELDHLSVPVLGRAGSVFVFHNGLWHGGIENKTDSPRITAHIIYAPVWLRPIGSHRYPDEFKRALTPRRRLLLADNDNPRDIYLSDVYVYEEDGSIGGS